MSDNKLQAWFGGSFDPVHNGHLLVAQDIQEQLQLSQLHFLPCFLSPLKTATACSVEDRVAMLRLAIEDHPHFSLDLREVEKPGPSYTVETLQALRAEREAHDSAPLLWVLGWDAFMQLESWYHWEEILEYCNLVVARRPGFNPALPTTLQSWLQGRECIKEELREYHFGKVCFLSTPLIEIASSDIRERCRRGLSLRYIVPDKVLNYIESKGLFKA